MVPGKRIWISRFSKSVVLQLAHGEKQSSISGRVLQCTEPSQFANPDTNFTSPTFGVISSTAVNARVGQLALRFAF